MKPQITPYAAQRINANLTAGVEEPIDASPRPTMPPPSSRETFIRNAKQLESLEAKLAASKGHDTLAPNPHTGFLEMTKPPQLSASEKIELGILREMMK